jgi:hypothetical protein
MSPQEQYYVHTHEQDEHDEEFCVISVAAVNKTKI